MDLRDTVDYHIKATWHSLSRMYSQIASEYGLSQTTGYILINIEREGTPATKIAPKIGMEPTSLSRILKNMDDKGLIYREGDKNDKRVVRIYLTKEGKEKKKIAKEKIIEFNKKVIEKIKPMDLKTFVKVIQSINELSKAQ